MIREDTSAAWGWPLVEQFAQDVRQGSRALEQSPTFALAAIVTFALGIGMTTAIFSVVYGMLLRPLPLHESDRLVMVSTVEGTDVSGAVSPPNFMSLAENIDAGSGSFTHIAGFAGTEVTLTGAAEARRIRGARVSARFFETLNAVTILGRTFRREEHNAGLGHVAVLSYALWQQHFGSDRGVVERAVILNGVPHVVVGIMAPGFAFPYGGDFSILRVTPANSRRRVSPGARATLWSASSLVCVRTLTSTRPNVSSESWADVWRRPFRKPTRM